MTDTCVCCGRAVPEGRMVCQECEIEAEERLMAYGKMPACVSEECGCKPALRSSERKG